MSAPEAAGEEAPITRQRDVPSQPFAGTTARSAMRTKPFRAFALVATIALIVGACGSSTATNAAGASGGASGGASAAPTTTTVGGTAAPGQVDIRWYCCLGGGDAPEQVAEEKKVV